MTVDKDRLFKKLEHVGEYVVRENLERGVYGENRRGLVEEWLEQFEVEDEVEQLPEEPHEAENVEEQLPEVVHEADVSASDAKEKADESPPRKWYQRLFGIRGKGDTN